MTGRLTNGNYHSISRKIETLFREEEWSFGLTTRWCWSPAPRKASAARSPRSLRVAAPAAC
ncbi:hypothetical protein MESS2_1340015 [Mesorhizobium metallidurans STM 2683]|uniref:Uncharacterized protein n=1 Tax=Mesorhizobium metallidurans STM 2683 TaxID=1297569 RepID=M5EJR1_9HYPH|nr:hypothetical protein MESS2_1340015 [Mesorhizobium metallidurans STM 2683]